MKTLTLVLFCILAFVLVSCEKDENEYMTLTRSELNGKQYTQFEGTYNNKVYTSESIRFYSSIEFLSNYQYVAELRQGTPGNYTYSDMISEYKLNEMAGMVRFPTVDSVLMGNPPTKTAVFLADWILELKNDSMLIFRRNEYVDRSKPGYYEPMAYVALKRK
jgi:hypothetical protein